MRKRLRSFKILQSLTCALKNTPTNIHLLRSRKLSVGMMKANAGQVGVLAHARQTRNQRKIVRNCCYIDERNKEKHGA